MPTVADLAGQMGRRSAHWQEAAEVGTAVGLPGAAARVLSAADVVAAAAEELVATAVEVETAAGLVDVVAGGGPCNTLMPGRMGN